MKNIRTLFSGAALAMAALLSPLTATAGPAVPGRAWLTLTDGTRVEASLVGDEHGHCYMTADGRMLLPDGADRYAVATAAQAEAWRTAADQRRAAFNQHIAPRSPRYAETAVPTVGPANKALSGVPQHYLGERRGLIILANFKDVKFTYSKAEFERLLNEKGYSENGAAGCLNEYFYDQSYGKFDFEFDVVGPVELSENSTYYGSTSAWGNDVYVPTMIVEACRLADGEADYRTYDWDGDGEAEQVFVVYAGYGEHYPGNDPNLVWPQAGWLNSYRRNIKLDGININTFACGSELAGQQVKNEGVLGGIGTFAHEFTHCFGIPDLYHTDSGAISGTPDCWDIMSRGSYNGPELGARPCGFSAYERWMCGWLDFTDLTVPTTVTGMPPISDEPVAYRIVNPNNANEYFIMENRTASNRWYSHYYQSPGVSGVLLAHVDYDERFWRNNTVNQDDYEHYAIVGAYGGTDYRLKLFGGSDRNEWNGVRHYNIGAKVSKPYGALGNAPDILVTNIQIDDEGKASFEYDKLTNRYEVGNFLDVHVSKFDFAPRANKRLKVRQPVELDVKATGEKPFLDLLSIGYAMIPEGCDVEDYLAMPDEDLTRDGAETYVCIAPNETYSTTTYFTPREKGLYYLELSGRFAGFIDCAVLAVGVDLPEGIDGIRIDQPAQTPVAVKRLENGRIVITDGQQRHGLDGVAIR